MTLLEMALLAVAGFAAGILNAVAGGGTIFTFSALLAVGMPPVAANATSATAVVLGSVASAVAYRREIILALRRLLPLCAVSILGGGTGAALLLWSGDQVFRALVPWLLLFATLLFAAAPYIQRALKPAAPSRHRRGDLPLAMLVQGLVAIYGGYFGAGMGVMMLASLALTETGGYHAANAAKNLLAIVLQVMAVVVFLFSGVVDLELSLIIAISSIIGGWVGVVAARRIPQAVMRHLVIVCGLALALWYFVR
ncbi:sulfite exporter TauE/SafE family protein [Rhodoligotrophos defluvii]|uniref:sulfite exporter TauE/SafE family protein n=1 Tax=Rhodoligotrophos defluvii TaxID=2561934 RepID=UPI0010C99898|nr:sulfite exporter TauE/SafE family protein [Rhodoligotrophos defluvii]